MKALNQKKSLYLAPEIVKVNIDNDISLQLQSDPPAFESNADDINNTNTPFFA